MKRSYALPALALLSAALWLGGCNQRNQEPEGTKVTVNVISPYGGGDPRIATVVYQVGDGDWQMATQEDLGVYSFTVPDGETKYGVAVGCPAVPLNGIHSSVNVYQLTTDEATAIKAPCPNALGSAITPAESVKAVAAAGDSGYDKVWLHTAWDNRQTSLGNPASLIFSPESNRDLLIVAYSDSSTKVTPQFVERIRFVRDFDASQPPLCPAASPCSFELGSTDAPASNTVAGFTAPADASSTFFGVGFVSKKGLPIPHSSGDPDHNPALGAGDATGGSYWLVPGAESGDVYYAEAVARRNTNVHSMHNSLVFDYAGGDISFSLPAAWFDPSVQENALPTFGNLTYSDPNLIGYAFFFGKSLLREFVVVSKGWLAGSQSYTLPDLSGAPGFAGTKPLPGDRVAWDAIAVMANKTIGEILAADPLPIPSPLPRLPGLEIQTADKSGEYTVSN
ncbi:MAG TPA: hypothetical protein ENK37_06505 [Oceanithermus profundus]|uniref:Carboxypeptidase regulatory-like domain-containing protein n=1 Tax=Oceanithermus profundus TaxID=187137 RepID=A0A7C4VCH7_9DEIN|nr:hypothetical protein [Oceanithermus profundus]